MFTMKERIDNCTLVVLVANAESEQALKNIEIPLSLNFQRSPRSRGEMEESSRRSFGGQGNFAG